MSENQIRAEFLSIPGVPDSGNMATVTGTTQSFLTAMNGVAASTVSLTRKPALSAAAVTAGSITFDAAGIYTITVTVGGSSRGINVCVWPAACLGTKVTGDGRTLSTTCLQGAMNDPRFTIATAEAALEGSTPVTPDKWIAVWVGGQPVNFGAYV